MDDINHTTTHDDPTSDGVERLPATVRAFTAAHEVRDVDAVLALLVPGAVVTDVGQPYIGEESQRRFFTEAGTEFTYTDVVTGARREGDTWVVAHHLEGDFPGGAADLDYRFVLAGDLVSRLDIVAV